ncbi:phospholipase C/P1 nuclease [Gymnopus androsaceus JB14]|uniref:Phospholipase C/P1 nuclease n=1 Tax=Gymnopus androsaceus JB14 TaxID=1447944 RepID=A0A6A4HHP5_9AGAR|nr:phospholipase C/P1 nuclease [Gymnopus androsaceus JB14]
MKLSTNFVLLVRVYGWGAKGHEAVGYIAMKFLAPKASSFVETSLSGSTYHSSLGIAAPWADEVRYRKGSGYAWSAPLHFVDAEDDPPTECSVIQNRDCTDKGCILTAIANYTSRLIDTSLSDDERQEALKFVDHFVGDIGQPLHVEGMDRGGNSISVTCAGERTNLHAVYDGIINKLLEDQYDNSVASWVDALTDRIQASTRLFSPIGSIDDESNCPLIWAKESNAYDCTFVWSYKDDDDLCSDRERILLWCRPIIEMQIAKQGYRLAAWLNVLFDGETNLP